MWAWLGKVVLGPLFGFFRDLIGDWQKQKEAEGLGASQQAQKDSEISSVVAQAEAQAIANAPKTKEERDAWFDGKS